MFHYHQGIALLSAVSLCGMLLLHSDITEIVNAQNPQKIVVLGDSVSTRAGLSEGQKSYIDWITYYTDTEIQNFAQEKYTTQDVLQSLSDPQIQTALSESDIILITVGLYDIMIPFQDKANSYLEEFGAESFWEVFNSSPDEYGITSQEDMMYYSNQMAAAARQNKKSASENIKLITETLAQYQNAKIIFQTVYNPLDTIEYYSDFSMKKKTAYDSICNPINTLVNSAYNTYLHEQEELGNCLVADVCTEFKTYAYQYTNMMTAFEPTPNAEGHQLIADMILEKAGLEKKDFPEPTAEETTTESTSTTSTTETISTTSTTESTSTTSTTETTSTTSTTESTSTTSTTESTSTTSTTESTSTTSTTETTSTTSTTETTSTTSTTESTSTTSTTESTSTTSTTETTSTTSTTESTSTTSTTEPIKETLPVGDLNQDHTIDAEDAAKLLQAAANMGAQMSSGLSPELEQAADVNHDGDINAEDAAVILVYAAGNGSGQITVDFDEYLRNLV